MNTDYLPLPRLLSAERVQQMRIDIERFAADHPPRTRVSRWRRPRFLGGLGVAILVIGGGGASLAIALVHSKPVTQHSVARCYTVATYQPGRTFPGTTVAEADTVDQRGQVQNALQVCAAMWRAGILQPGVADVIVHPGKPFFPVPALVGCTLPDGTAAIFPGSVDTCQRLTLSPQDPAVAEPSQPVSSGTAPASASP